MLNLDPFDVTEQLLARVQDGDPNALDELLLIHRPFLRRLVELRFANTLRSRVDPSDVVQESQLVIARRIGDFLARRPFTFRVWIRRETLQRLEDERRRHVVAGVRSVRREQQVSELSSGWIAAALSESSPVDRVMRAELAERIREVIESLGSLDREILAMRHVEGLTNAEVAESLGLGPETSRKRYGRALRRLDQKLTAQGLDLGTRHGPTT